MQPEPFLLRHNRVHDERGWFSCVWREAETPLPVVEENHSFSALKGTIRGLHWQEPQQAKLVRVLRGAILDACVRLSDGKVFTYEISACGTGLYVPEGYAHGFCTLTDETMVSYKVSAAYAPGQQFGIDAFDPALAIDWPVTCANAIMSDKDRTAQAWAKLAA